MIHQYQNNGYNIVLDVNSGSVHVVDKIAYDVIECLEEMNPAHTSETLKEEKTADNGYNIVLDVNSGSVHVVDKIAYDVIECLEEMNPAHTSETLKEEKTAADLIEKLGDTYPEEDLRDVLEAVAELTEQDSYLHRIFMRIISER